MKKGVECMNAIRLFPRTLLDVFRNARRFSVGLAVFAFAAQLSALANSGETLWLTTRPNVATAVFWWPNPDAKATLLLFPGGSGGYGGVVDGLPRSRNFLVRSTAMLRNHGFNVAIFGKPRDQPELNWDVRVGRDHLTDVRAVVAHLKTLSDKPVWLVGTSAGTVSATAAAIAMPQGEIAGLVLTATVTNRKFASAVPLQNVEALRYPVLLYHHADDACKACNPADMPWLFRQLTNASPKRLMLVRGGEGASGDVCEAMHYHGFIGMEAKAVADISNWIIAPTP
jgi:pimeloyl-ACP methyl ester carboxylesterase